MKRKKANQFYFFNENYFKNLKKIVDKNGYFITARLEKKMIGASIFLNFNNNSNYYLSSVSDGFKHPGVSSSIIVKGAEIGIKNKIKTINLGGGNSNSDDDSLYLFKKRIGNNKKNFYISKIINNTELYDKLIKIWKVKFPNLISKYDQYLQKYNFVE